MISTDQKEMPNEKQVCFEENTRSKEENIPSGQSAQQVPRLYEFTLLALLVALAVLICAIAPVTTAAYGHDIFIALDAGWRVVCGQRPHVDFFTGWGPVVPLLVGLGIGLSGGTAAGVGYASGIAGLLLSIWAYGITRRHLPFLAAATFSVFIFLLTATPVPLGEPAQLAFSHAMYFNRWTMGLLGIVLMESLLSETSKTGGGISTGAACAVLFFSKVNMFLIALGLIAPSLLLRFNGKRNKGMLIGFALITVPLLAYMGFDAVAILRDYRIVALAKSSSVASGSLRALAWGYLGQLLVLLVLAFLVAYSKKPGQAIDRSYFPVMALAAFTAGLLSLWTNTQRSEMPLVAVFALFSATRLMKAAGLLIIPSLKWQFAQAAVIGACLFVFHPLQEDIPRMIMALKIKFILKPEPAMRFNAAPLRNYLVFGGPQADGRPVDGPYLVMKVNDGLELLSKNSTGRESVITYDFVNYFSFAQHRVPNIGGADQLVYGPMFNDKIKPDPQKVIGTADLVMLPKVASFEPLQFQGFLRNYGPYLQANFRPVAESRYWVLWKKNGDGNIVPRP
jgi:hypothetical protein